MDIPKRRKHLLEEVVKIYQDTLSPVHLLIPPLQKQLESVSGLLTTS